MKNKNKDYGNVYFYNMTNRTLNIQLNEAVEKLVIEAVKFVTAPGGKATKSKVEKKVKEKVDNVEVEVDEIIETTGIEGGNEYKFFCKSTPRNADPKPYESCIFGIDNKIVYWLADDELDKRVVEIAIDPDEPGLHINEDLQILVFLDSVILRVAGHCRPQEVTIVEHPGTEESEV